MLRVRFLLFFWHARFLFQTNPPAALCNFPLCVFMQPKVFWFWPDSCLCLCPYCPLIGYILCLALVMSYFVFMFYSGPGLTFVIKNIKFSLDYRHVFGYLVINWQWRTMFTKSILYLFSECSTKTPDTNVNSWWKILICTL